MMRLEVTFIGDFIGSGRPRDVICSQHPPYLVSPTQRLRSESPGHLATNIVSWMTNREDATAIISRRVTPEKQTDAQAMGAAARAVVVIRAATLATSLMEILRVAFQVTVAAGGGAH